MKYRVILFVSLLLLSVFVLAESYTVRLDQYTYTSLGLPGLEVKLEKVPPQGLKISPVLSDALYGRVKLADNTIYIAVGRRDGKMVLFVNRDGSGCFTQRDITRLVQDPRYKCLTSEPTAIPLKYGAESHDYVVKFFISTFEGTVHLSLLEAFQRAGYMMLNGVRHEIFLSNIKPTGRFDDLKDDVIGVDVEMSPSGGGFYPLHSTKNGIEIGDKRFLVERISPAGTEIELKVSGMATSVCLSTGDVLNDLLFEVLDRSAPLKTKKFHMSDLKGSYVLFYAWRGSEARNTEATPTVLTKEINEIYEKYRARGLKVIGVDMFARLTNPRSEIYQQLRLRFFMDDNKIGFWQLTPRSSIEISKILNLSYPSEICLIAPDGVILYRTEVVWNAYGESVLKSISINQLNNILDSLLSRR